MAQNMARSHQRKDWQHELNCVRAQNILSSVPGADQGGKGVSQDAMVRTCGCMRLRTEALGAVAQITSLWRQDDSPAAKANGNAPGPAATDNPRALSCTI